MSMHLVGPYLTTTGKKKGKQKYRSAAHAQQARQLEEEWKDLKKRWGAEQEEKKRKQAMAAPVYSAPPPVHRDSGKVKPKSLNTWTTGAVSSKPVPQYTGSNMIGISIIHKSCLQPIFTKEEAVDSARMRR